MTTWTAILAIASTALLASGCMGNDTYRKALALQEKYPESELKQFDIYKKEVTFFVRLKDGSVRVVRYRPQDLEPWQDEELFSSI